MSATMLLLPELIGEKKTLSNALSASLTRCIPGDWKQVYFSELFLFKNGVNADKQAYGQGIPFVNVLEVITRSHLRAEHVPGLVSLRNGSIDTYRLRRGDVLFNRTSETQDEVGLAAVYLDDVPIVFGGFVIRGRPTSDVLDPLFAGYVLRSSFIRKQVTAMGQGAIRANIGQGDLKQVSVFVPEKSEQKRIGAALSDVDTLIQALDKLIGKKRAIKLAAMQQLLSGRKRLMAFGGVCSESRQTGISAIRNEWECIQLGAVIDLLAGYPFPSRYYSKSGIRLVRGANIKRGSLDWSDEITEYWPRITKDVEKFELAQGDLVVAMDGAQVGRSYAVVSHLDLPCLLLQRVARIRPRKVVLELLPYLIGSNCFSRYVDSVKTQTAIPHISPQDIRNFVINTPRDPAEQSAIAAVFSSIDSEIAGLERRRDKIKAIKQGMMQSLLTGRIRLVKPGAQE